MDNIGDWLYIVFLVIAGIGSLLSSGKKKKYPKSILGEPEKDIISEEWGFPKKEELTEQKPQILQPKQEIAIKPKKKQKKTPAPFLETVESQPTTSAIPKPASIPSELTAEEEQHPTIHLNDRDELQKAVIYAEILNQKY